MITSVTVASSDNAARPIHRRSGGQFRAHARRNVRLRAMLTHIGEGWQRQTDVLNLGLGGCCVSFEGPEVRPGEVVSLSFVAPTLWDPLVIRARIAWVKGGRGIDSRAGISFEHKSASAVLALFELVATTAYDG